MSSQDYEALPKGWAWASPGSFFRWASGKFLPKKMQRGGGVPVFGGNGVNGQHDEALVSNPTIVVGRVGAHCGNIHLTHGPAWITDNAIYAIQGADSSFLPYWALALSLQNLNANAGGTGQPYVNQRHLEELRIALAPKPEQQRIVDALESYFRRLDDTVVTLERVERNLKRYRTSVLKSAVEGRLVPTEAQLSRQAGHTFEPAIDLLSRFPPPPRPNRWNSRSSDIVVGHAALAIGNPQTTLPEGWSWIPLVDVARMESGHTPSRAHPEWWNGDVPWLSIPDARDHDGRTIRDTTQHTNAAGLANSAARILPSGTVSICRTAFSIGYVVVLGRPMATSQDFVNWTPTGAVSSHWLRLVFGADREALRRFGKGSVNKTIYFPEWLSIHVALPPLAEQERIVKEVDRLVSLAESTEVSVGRNLRQCDKVRKVILKWAFEGKLADQDLNDEPASVLLERIKTEREAGKRAKVTGPQRTATKKQVRA